MSEPKKFTRIFNKEDGSVGRKEGVLLTASFSYIEPCLVKDKSEKEKEPEPISCTKIFYGNHFVILDITMKEFLKQNASEIEFI